MRILITGGSGLIGRSLVAELAGESEHELIILSRSPPERVRGLPAGARAVPWDGTTSRGWGGLVDGQTGIVHLAGENIAGGRWTEARKRRLRDSRLGASRAVLAAIEEAAEKPSFLIQASAVGFYGDRGDQILTEDSAPGDDFLADLSVDWERSTEAAESLGVRRALLRTGIVLAAGGGALPKMAQPFKLFLGAPLGDGRHWMPWIHIRDEVAAIRFLIEQKEASGAYNLTAPRPVTNRVFSRALARALHRPCAPLGVPRAVLHLALGEMAGLLLASQRAVPRRLEEAGFTFRHPDLEPALADLLG